jgi:2-polyprenyl-3-methyl-5-hydroxy-6-metoxy-1,4-benzoquinol methylase
MSRLVSKEYTQLLRTLHEQNPDWGTSAHNYAGQVPEIMRRTGCADVLDYGAGKGVLRQVLGAVVSNYDPATFPEPPLPHELVVCLDVLEHIEPDCLRDVLQHIRSVTRRAVYFAISTVPAQQLLPDGRNAHLIVQHSDWWADRLRPVFGEPTEQRVYSHQVDFLFEVHDEHGRA